MEQTNHYGQRPDEHAVLDIAAPFEGGAVEACLEGIRQDFPGQEYELEILSNKFRSFRKPGMKRTELYDSLIQSAAELTSREAPRWEFIAARIRYSQFGEELEERLAGLGISGFYDKLVYLTREGLYGDYILEHYTEAEIREAETFLDPERNKLFTYSGLDLLIKRYVIQNHKRQPLETPQEMYLGIALHLAMEEKPDCRMAWVRRFYDMLSNMQVTMATPTLSNAR